MYKYRSFYFFVFLLCYCLFSCKSTTPLEEPVFPTTIQTTSQTSTPANVKIFETTNGNKLGPCEPSIFINPKKPNQLVAGSVIDFVHRSMDGGKTWKTQQLKSTLGIWGDPVITADKNGTFYYFHLSDPEGTNWSSSKILDQIVVQKSTDFGTTWSSGVGIGHNPPKQQDKQWASSNPITGELYVTWTEFDRYGSTNPKDMSRILFSSSKDSGATWSNPMAINQYNGDCIDKDNTVEGAVPASDGKNLYVAWTFNNKIWFDYSTDNGKTWQEKDIIITSQQSGWDFTVPGIKRVNGMPVTGVDNSDSVHKGTIYVNWSDQVTPEDTDIFISKSIDKGKTWSPPKRVNTDSTKTHQFLTWMSIDPATGYIYIVYYDRSAYDNRNTDVSLAVSKDGGTTFTSKIISEKPFDPTGASFFGDYNCIHALNGYIRPIWTRYENKKLSIWTALINTENK